MPTDYQKLAYVERVTGHRIPIGLLESVSATVLGDEQIIVTMQRAEVTSTSRGLIVRRYGLTMHAFLRQGDRWVRQDPITTWDGPALERHVTVYVSEAERLEQARWEDLCHRPGTSRTPMDNYDRRQQEV